MSTLDKEEKDKEYRGKERLTIKGIENINVLLDKEISNPDKVVKIFYPTPLKEEGDREYRIIVTVYSRDTTPNRSIIDTDSWYWSVSRWGTGDGWYPTVIQRRTIGMNKPAPLVRSRIHTSSMVSKDVMVRDIRREILRQQIIQSQPKPYQLSV